MGSLKVVEQEVNTIRSTFWKGSFNSTEYNEQKWEIIQEIIYVTIQDALKYFVNTILVDDSGYHKGGGRQGNIKADSMDLCN